MALSGSTRYSRRQFISRVGSTAVAATITQRSKADKHLGDAPVLVDQNIKGLFHLSKNTIHLNAAHMCPMPRVVNESLARLNREIDENPSSEKETALLAEKEKIRTRIAVRINAGSANEVALVRNTTEGNSIVINGLELGRGDEVVLWDQNHQSNNVAWDVRAAREGFRVKRVSLTPEQKSPTEILAAFDSAIGNSTRVLSLTHISNISGFRLPIEALCQLAKERGLYSHVDGAQSWGVLPIDLSAMGCDSFTGSAHKWLMGPREVGLLYLRSEAIARVWPSEVGLSWGDEAMAAPQGARRYESFGQRDDGAIAAMRAALNFRETIGEKVISRHALKLSNLLAREITGRGLKLASYSELNLPSPILIVATPEAKRAAVARALSTQYGVNVSTKGGIRFSPHIYNSEQEIHFLADVLKQNQHWFSI